MLAPIKEILGLYWADAKRSLTTVLMVTILASITSVALPYLFSRLLDELAASSLNSAIITGFVFYAVLLGINAAFGETERYLAYMNAEKLNFVANTSFFKKLLRKESSFFIDHNPAEIQRAQSRGEDAFHIVLHLVLLAFLPGFIQIVLAVVTLGAVVNWQVGVIVVVYGTAFITFTYYANKWTRHLMDNAIEAGQANAKYMGNIYTAIESLRYVDGSDRWMTDNFVEKAKTIRDRWWQFCLRRSYFAGLFGVALTLQFLVTYWVLMPQYSAGELSIGDIVLFNMLLLLLNSPFQMIGQSIDECVKAYSNFKPFAEIWNSSEEAGQAETTALTLKKGELKFEQVGFSYEGGTGVEDVSFVAKRGAINFLCGKTGSGKSTLFKLALKSIHPSSGRILLDDIDLTDVPRRQLTQHIGVVPQEILLLNDSLKTNILVGRSYDEARLRMAAEKAAILDFIDGLPDGFDTTVGERGMKLSGGERQRIAIARALYSDPAVLFLDEASSALDHATEQSIMQHLRRVAGDVTIIAITHRLDVIEAEDQVIELKSGQLAAANEAEPISASD